MLTVFFSWLIIGAAAFIFGKAIVDGICRKDIQRMGKPDIYIVTGIAFLNIYAQLFSVFYKVAGIACTILGAIGLLLVIVYGAGCFRAGKRPVLLPGIKMAKTQSGTVQGSTAFLKFTVHASVDCPGSGAV